MNGAGLSVVLAVVGKLRGNTSELRHLLTKPHRQHRHDILLHHGLLQQGWQMVAPQREQEPWKSADMTTMIEFRIQVQ